MASTTISLEGIDGPLRHYRVSMVDDRYRFEHRAFGTRFEIDAEAVLDEYHRRFGANQVIGTPLLDLFTQFAGPLCHACGGPVPAPQALCEVCEHLVLADLRAVIPAG